MMKQGFMSVSRILKGRLYWQFGVFFSALMVWNVKANTLTNIDFRSNHNKQAIIIVEFASPIGIVDIQQGKRGLSINLLKTVVKDEQIYLIDVKDFATVVDSLEVFREGVNTRIEVFIGGGYRHDYRVIGQTLEVTVSPRQSDDTPSSQAFIDKKNKPISINFQDIPVRNVLQLIAEHQEFNVVVSDSVEGHLTLRLDGVPWQQVLDIILKVKGLDKRVEGNVILIAPKEELDLREKQQLEKRQLDQEMGDLATEIIKVNFAKASDIAAIINAEGKMSMLSARGRVATDERTNALLIRELPSNINRLRELIASLDIPVKQVQIEARIVIVQEGNMDELGIRWGFSSSHGNSRIGGSIESNIANIGLYGRGEDQSNASLDDFLNVNLAATSPSATSIAFQVAKLGTDTLLDLELSALQQESKAEIISSPRLLTTNKKPAYIEQGSEIPYLESSSSGASSVAFKKAVLSLEVTPQITPDNRLVLDLNVTQDRPGQIVKTGTGEAVAIETQRIGTQVLVDDGETIVLGGIFQHSVTNSVDKVPLLGDLPLLGALFRRSYERAGKSELLIFVTPKVLIQ
ncbi:type 4 pilus biogenesis protein PilQ [Vibrio azureus NBRC 104587]|uniref:Type 4 pilus biogenesis protein PilQ n=2 Tax=Vibrio azureus TaxID=512649 RepID=U3ATA1_9VIBR|nr:type 4 pilus biogenesis protein PilQ [Vibrio azureus NBRC 104587]